MESNKVKTNEQKLRESEEKYRNLVNDMREMIGKIEANGEIVYASPQTFELTGFRPEESIGKNWFKSYVHPEDLTQIAKAMKSSKDSQGGFEPFDFRLRHKDGHYIHVSGRGKMIKENGKIRYIATFRDITKRTLAELKLKTSEVKYRHLFETSPYFIGLVNSEGVLIDCNDVVNEFLSVRSIEDVKGKNLKEIILLNEKNTHLIPLFEKAMKNIFEGVNQEGFDFRINRSIGGYIWLHYEGTLIEIEKQKLIQLFLQDITERKKMMEELRIKDIVFNASLSAQSTADINGIIDHVNSAFLELWGYKSKEEAIGNSVGSLFVNPDDAVPVLKALTEAGKWESEFLAKRCDGSTFISQGFATAIYNEQGEHIGFQSANLDITARKRSEQLHQETIEDLARINAELEQFTYIASHDLKEPLRMISSFAQLLEKQYKDKLDEDANDFIRFITEGAVRMQDLINSLLAYSRIGKHYKEFERVDLNDVLKDVIDNLTELINKTNAEVIYDSLPSLFVDKCQSLQVFQNLISNAIKFHGKEPPQVHVSARLDNKYWVFSIRDNGIGIKPKDFERIFVIFQRLHGKDEYDGTGIGLAICKKIVEQYGGNIWVESEIGKCSTFYFSIPKTEVRN